MAHRLTPIGATAAALVVANPHARRVRRGEWRKPAERALGRRYGIEIVSPGSAEEAALLVRERMAAEQRPAVVVAAGGDGTVRLVAQELAGTGVPLGVYRSSGLRVRFPISMTLLNPATV